MEKEIQELINKLALESFFVKSSKGNYLAVTKRDGKWIAQGKEVTRESDVEYLNKQYENTIKDLTKTYNNIMEELEYGLWDSGNLSISQQKILDYLLENGICVRTPGIPGEHDTANGVAKWIYTLKESMIKEYRVDIKSLNESIKSLLNEDNKIEKVKTLANCKQEKQTIDLYKVDDKFVVMWSDDAVNYPDTSVDLELTDNENDALEAFFDSDYVRNVDDYDMFVDEGYIKITDKQFRKLAKDILG